MNSLLRLILLVNLLCPSTTGLAIFGLPSPRLHSLRNSSSGDDDCTETKAVETEAVETEAIEEEGEDEANVFENIIRSVSRNKQCELLKFVCALMLLMWHTQKRSFSHSLLLSPIHR